MAERLVNVDRDTPMLLPVDLRQWVPEDDLVHEVLRLGRQMGLVKVGMVSVDGTHIKANASSQTNLDNLYREA